MTRSAMPLLMSPGPVQIEASAWGGLEQMHHRTGRFRAIVRESSRMLAGLAGASGEVFLLTMSGTGAMESAVVNLAPEGSRLLAVSGGKFGDRWEDIASRYGVECRTLRFASGKRIDPAAVRSEAGKFGPQMLCLTQVESSTGLLAETGEILASLPEPRPLVVLDAVASVATEELKADEWGVDLVVGAGQKGLAAPPGVSFVIASRRAVEAAASCERPSYYMSYGKYLEGAAVGDTPFTPAVHGIQILHASLSAIFDEGAENYRLRHALYSEVFLEAMEAAGVRSFPEIPSSSVQALEFPGGMDVEKLRLYLREKEGITVAGGQGGLKGRILRTGFLGIHRPEAVRRLAEAIARGMSVQGSAPDTAAMESVLCRIDECADHSNG